ncbi:MAG: glutamate racemase [Chloroflexi bacterium]|nr:glutamate racemase [Chloroflexota bacterium]MBI5715631.1 glutamate racemase [Chloroflexota bacterium]
MNNNPLGIFDSGLGGLSVLKEIRALLPDESILYFADQGRVPYGPRPKEEIQKFSDEITRFLLEHGAKVIVVACNTASAAALESLRQTFPHIPFVGMEPAIKPAAEKTKTGAIGVIATLATFESERFARVVDRFAKGVRVLAQPSPDLVIQVENGEFDTPRTREMLHHYLDPLLADGIDSIVLGCTHYSFLAKAIGEVVGDTVEIIDPAPAVAKQVKRVIDQHGLAASAPLTSNLKGAITAYTSGDPSDKPDLPTQMLGESIHFRKPPKAA